MTEDLSEHNKGLKKLWIEQLKFNTALLDNIEQRMFVKKINSLPEYTDKRLSNIEVARTIKEIKRELEGNPCGFCRWIYLKDSCGTLDYYIDL